jgi:dipeptidyl aminopeptidase/acylaminoacyl peptidase
MFSFSTRTSFRAALLAGVALLTSSFALAQATDHAHLDELLRGLNRGHSVGQVAVSPDGQHLAWIEWTHEGQEIRLASLADPAKSERVTAAAKSDEHCDESDLTWEPDAKALAFFSDCAHPGKQTDLYLSHLDGHAVRRLTELKGYVDAPAFSPDGSRIAFLYVEGATRPAGALAAMKPPSGVIGEDGIEIQRVAMARTDATKPEAPEEATPAKLHVFEFDWRPDSKGLAYVAADPPGENNWWVAKLYTEVLGAQPQAILSPSEIPGPLHGLQIAVPRWSPDGKNIAFIGGLMSDQGATGGDLWLIPAAGGQPRNLTPQRPASPAWIEWSGNDTLFVSEVAGGNAQLVRFRLRGDQAEADAPLFNLSASVSDSRFEQSLSTTADHQIFVFHASSFERAPEIYLARTGLTPATSLAALTQLTHLNDGVKPAWGDSVSLTWKSGPFNVQGWLMLPKDFNPAKKYPLIVLVHGGPASAMQAYWGADGFGAATFSALGYFVLQPNPRGSFGQGEAFTQANRQDFGYGDLGDILAGVDTALAKYPIDPNRVGLTGWSYGGFMSMFAVTQTHRFRAAVAGAGISDWQSYYGENSIAQWMPPYFGATVYDDPAVYAKSSAINFIKQVQTPILIVVGDRDGECPAPQSYEFWNALRDRHVPTQLVVYPNEGHGFTDHGHRRDVIERAIDWFARYMPATQ